MNGIGPILRSIEAEDNMDLLRKSRLVIEDQRNIQNRQVSWNSA